MRKSSITTIEMWDYFCRIKADFVALQDKDRSLTFAEWEKESQKLANALSNSGVVDGDKVAVLTYNCADVFVILYAIWKIGAVCTPINYRLSPQEFKFVLSQSESKAIICETKELCEKIDSISAETELKLFLRLDESDETEDTWQNLDSFMKDASTAPSSYMPKPDDQAYQMYTSGTTGFPKGVMISQQQLALQVFHIILIPPRADAGTNFLIVPPLFHAAALVSGIVALAVGRPLVIHREFDPLQVVETLVDEGIDSLTVVPAMLWAILEKVPNIDQYDFSSLNKIVYGASPISLDLLKRSMDTFGCEFQQGFGMTEAVSSVVSLTCDDHHKALKGRPELLRSCGRAGAFVELKIVDPDTHLELPTGEIGEIVLRTPYIMSGYSKQPDKTAEVLDDEGWYYSGDGGYVDEEGYVYIKDRIKDMIVSGAENVYPAEVENALMSHPDITDIAVIGLPDEKYGEAVVAVCVKKPETGPTDDELIDFCRDNLAGYKIPRRYIFIDELPRNPSGKILKRRLREQFSD